MSRLLRTKEPSSKERASAQIALSQSKVVMLIKACQSLCGDIIQDEFTQFLSDYDRAFDLEIDGARSNQQVQDFIRAQKEFKRSKEAIGKVFCFNLTQGFNQFSRKELSTVLDLPKNTSEASGAQALSLLDDDTLNESIAVSSLLLKTQLHCKESLWMLNNRFAVLNDGEPVKALNNPVAPVQFCMAFKKAFADVDLDSASKALAYTVFTQCIVTLCERVLSGANDYFKSQGVLPFLSYAPLHRKIKKPRSLTSTPSQSRPSHAEPSPFESLPRFDAQESAQNQEKMIRAIRKLQESASLRSPSTAEHVNDAHVSSVSKLTQADAAKRFTSVHDEREKGVTLDVKTRNTPLQNQYISHAFNRHDDQSSGENNSDTIELVGRVFSFMLSDDNLPNQIKTLLSHLHTPFLKIAFMDKRFFEQVEHPARELLNTLAESGVMVIDGDDSLNMRMHEKIQDTVNTVVTEFDNDLRLITKVLIDFKRYVKSIQHRQELTERRTTEKIKGQEKFEAVKSGVNNYIQSAIEQCAIPSVVLIFLLQPWSDYLSFILLRHGKQSSQWGKAIKVVNDLLWVVRTHSSPKDKEKQLLMLPELKETIALGFAAIVYDEVQAKRFLDALDSMTMYALKDKLTAPIDNNLRERIEKNAALKAGNVTRITSAMTPEEAKMLENLKYLEFGSWFEFDTGKRLKLAWFNKRMGSYLFVDQAGRKVEMIASIDMAKGLIGKRIKLIPGSSKPFFERALESIYKQLNTENNKVSV